MLTSRQSKVLGGTMLIAGTSIGAAMLAMPILTGLFGFLGTVVILIACWLFMYWTATLILEASLQFEDGKSFISMAQKTLGPLGAGATWLTFLLLFYALVAAYLKGSGHIIMDMLENLTHIQLPPFFEIFPLLVLFAPFIYFGLSAVDHVNRVLMVGMGISYVLIICWLFPHIAPERLLYVDFDFSLLSFSVVVTSFGYHVIIPTLVVYLERDVASIKKCLFYGSFIPLVLYFLWELTILGTVDVHGEFGFAQAFAQEIPLAKLLRLQVGSEWISVLARFFSVFAIVTSFLGVAQGLFDFLKDGLHAKASHQKRLLAFILTFLPPVLFIVLLERGFIALLDYAGALVSIILGIIPILIVWRLRLHPPKVVQYRARGQNGALTLGGCFFAFVVIVVLLKNCGLMSFPVQKLF